MKRTRFRTTCGLLLAASLLVSPVASFAQKKDEQPESSPLACAFFFARRLDPEGSNWRNESLAHIAKTNWLIGKPDQALSALGAMRCDERAYMSGYLAGEAVKAGQKDYALKFIEQTMASCAREEEDFYQKGIVLNGFVENLVELQEFDRALAVAELLEDETSSKALAFLRLAAESAKNGQSERALDLLDRAFAQARAASEEERDETCRALGRIAALYAQLDKPEQAAAAFSLAAQLAEENDADGVRGRVAIAHAEAGHDETALHLAELINRDEDKVDTLVAVAHVYALRGRKAKALSLLSQVALMVESADGDGDDGRQFNGLVKAYLQADEPQQALQVMGKIDDDFYRKEATLEIADWALKHGREDMAVEALDSATQKFRLIVSEKPSEILPEMSASRAKEKAMYLSAITDRYLAARQFDKAQQAAVAIDLPQWKAGKLADVAGAALRAWPRAKVKDLLAQALRLSERAIEYPHDLDKGSTLANIAAHYAQAGDRAEASRLFARLLETVRGLEDYEGRLERLVEIGFRYEQAGMKPDAATRSTLRRIIKEWAQD